MITTDHTQEALSRSYIHAVAGMAGLNYSLGAEFDYGFDGTFRPVALRNNRRVESGFPLDFQLKCTWNWSSSESVVTYGLKSKTYNDFVSRDPDATGAVLILLCLPASIDQWAEVSEDCLLLKKCCYFTALSGEPVANENSTKTIHIPRTNLLTPANLNAAVAAERLRRMGAVS